MGVEMEAGFVCGGARERSRSLHACMVCHARTVGTIDSSLAMQLDPLPPNFLIVKSMHDLWVYTSLQLRIARV